RRRRAHRVAGSHRHRAARRAPGRRDRPGMPVLDGRAPGPRSSSFALRGGIGRALRHAAGPAARARIAAAAAGRPAARAARPAGPVRLTASTGSPFQRARLPRARRGCRLASPACGWRIAGGGPAPRRRRRGIRTSRIMDRDFRFSQALGLCAAAAAVSAAWADQGLVPPYEFDPIVITGVAPEAPLTFTTDPKIPRQPVPASDGTDYLRTIPGFSAIRNGGSNGDPVLRGMFGSRLNILANGASMPGACPLRMDAPSSYISPENFDQLTV